MALQGLYSRGCYDTAGTVGLYARGVFDGGAPPAGDPSKLIGLTLRIGIGLVLLLMVA